MKSLSVSFSHNATVPSGCPVREWINLLQSRHVPCTDCRQRVTVESEDSHPDFVKIVVSACTGNHDFVEAWITALGHF